MSKDKDKEFQEACDKALDALGLSKEELERLNENLEKALKQLEKLMSK